MINFHPVLPVDSVPADKPVKCVVDGLSILVVRDVAGRVFAFENNCSHADKPLEKGRWDPNTHEMLCPFHKAVFDVAAGGAVKVGPAAVALQIYPIEVRQHAGQDTLFVGINSED